MAGEMLEYQLDQGSITMDADEIDNQAGPSREEDVQPIITFDTSIIPETDEERRREGLIRTRNFIRRLRTAITGSRIVHDVVYLQSESESKRCLSGMLKRKYQGGWFMWVWHDNHAHCVHDCPWSGGYCRCRRFADIPIKRNRRIIRSTTSLTEQAIYNLTKYLSESPRRIQHFEYSRRTRALPSEIGHYTYAELREHSEEHVVEGSPGTVELFDSQSCGPREATIRQDNSQSSKTVKGSSKFQYRNQKEELVQFFWRNAVCPILNIVNTSLWLTSPYKYMDTNNDVNFKLAIHIFTLEVCQKPYSEICETLMMYTPIFQAYLSSFDAYYYPIEYSCTIIEELLCYQVGEDNLYMFLMDLYKVIDKMIPKVNSFYVIGPPNAGKNFFFDSVLSSCIVTGQVGNFNRHCNFPLMECVNKRCLLWNEPNFEPAAVDTLKMLLGGDSMNVKVKNRADAIVLRTPLIILTNNSVFPNDTAFQSRMIKYTWRTAPFLKQYTLKLHPLSFYALLRKYTICQ